MGRIKMPSAYTILFLIIIIVAVLTWIVPAGEYDYVDPEAAKKEPIPGTYHSVDQEKQGIWDVVMSPVEGFYEAKDVALFVIVIGGFLGVVMKTGAIDAGIARVTSTLKGNEKWMIPILMILFGLGGTSFGMAEETIAFYPLLLPVFIAAGYDSVTAVSVILLGAGVGVLGSTVNPFATGIAAGFAGVSIGQGIGLRLLILIVGELAAIIFVMRYAEKVKKDPSKSIVHDMWEENRKSFLSKDDENEFPELTGKRKLILILFGVTFLIMVFGVIPFEDIGITAIPTLWWWFGELTALFLVSAIIIGLVAGLGEKKLISSFVSGARDLLGVALIVGVSRGITVVMNSGKITDTVLNLGENTLADVGSIAFAVLTYLFYIPLSFLIPSTSGLATLSMPIMAPLGDFANVARDIVITAYQSASGIVNLITPTSAVVMGGLAIAKLPYDRWLRYVWKLLVILMVIIIAALVVGVVF
ncbi:YfcC family protein [Sporosalibacterium faouarense]|uniref:YfcC family protein n=1 Tax=Sporosalibacterium faouarense TaxID=516123 RepID=UPI00141D03A1|nr:YfcC family protein [Sporosalibacterium faouarense]MTI49828.1 YfcC family protein [Bacillota bacterium]